MISNALPHVPREQITQLITGTSSGAYKALRDEDRKAVIPEITNALGTVWLMYAVAAGLSFVCSLPLCVRVVLALQCPPSNRQSRQRILAGGTFWEQKHSG